MKEMLPTCEVLWCEEHLPQAPKDHPEFWSIWRDVVRRYAGRPEAIFASEPYGERLAAEVDARFVPVDFSRSAFPVSGTAVRDDPFGQWQFLPPPVRAHFVRRVCLVGPESTGKSTLAKQLAARFSTICLSEYGRLYTDIFGNRTDDGDLERIALGHTAAVAAARRFASRILIEDTDPLMTGVWADILLGFRPASLTTFRDFADLYILCNTDVPWVDDGTRYFPDESTRIHFMRRCEEELVSRNVAHVVITGADWKKREAQAVAAITAAFPGLLG
jgi:NadR type nicotinamide-nucleotide adenylyltransferase